MMGDGRLLESDWKGEGMEKIDALRGVKDLWFSLQEFPQVQDFEVQHDYLQSSDPQTQIRIRKRGQNGMTLLVM